MDSKVRGREGAEALVHKMTRETLVKIASQVL